MAINGAAARILTVGGLVTAVALHCLVVAPRAEADSVAYLVKAMIWQLRQSAAHYTGQPTS